MKQKNEIISLTRGIAIILVVLGHCIQCGSGSVYYNEGFYNDLLHKIICSFHMPVFMLVSGYLFHNTISHCSFYEIIKKRVVALLLPAFIWKTIDWGIMFFTKEYSLKTWFIEYIKAFLKGYWFIWAILFCTVIVCAVHFIFKDSLIVFILIVLVSPFIPKFTNSSVFLFMIPYFIIGYLFKKYYPDKSIGDTSNKSLLLYILGATVLYLGLFVFYDNNKYIYTTGICVWTSKFSICKQLIIDYYRWLIGLVGSMLLILVISMAIKKIGNKTVKAKNLLSYLGDNTILIYLFSSILTGGYLPKITNGISSPPPLFVEYFRDSSYSINMYASKCMY